MAFALRALWLKQPSKQSTKPQSELVQIDDLSVLWRRSARRTRSMALKVDRQGQLIAMTPETTHISELKQLVLKRETWVRDQLAQHRQLYASKRESMGQSLWFMGEQVRVRNLVDEKEHVEHLSGMIVLRSRQALDRDALDRRLKKWLRVQAERVLASSVDSLSQRTGLHGTGLKVKAYNARWGSCRHDGLIQLNWKLIQTPPEIIEYVVLHELCHLRHFNHSASFWRLLGEFCPDYKICRTWLKDNGRLLITA